MVPTAAVSYERQLNDRLGGMPWPKSGFYTPCVNLNQWVISPPSCFLRNNIQLMFIWDYPLNFWQHLFSGQKEYCTFDCLLVNNYMRKWDFYLLNYTQPLKMVTYMWL